MVYPITPAGWRDYKRAAQRPRKLLRWIFFYIAVSGLVELIVRLHHWG